MIQDNSSYNAINSINEQNKIKTIKYYICIICIVLFFYGFGILIYTTLNDNLIYTCKHQVHLMNDIIDTCNITRSYFNENKCYNNIYYCNKVINEMNNNDNLCMPIINECFKQASSNGIYSLVQVIVFGYGPLIWLLIMSRMMFTLKSLQYKNNKYILYLLFLSIIVFVFLLVGITNKNITIIGISYGFICSLTYTIISYVNTINSI